MKDEIAFAMGIMNCGRELMVFDWNKAARIIKERKPIRAGAGLRDDWENTGGEIFANGTVVKNVYTYLASTWDIPELALAFEDGSQETMDCYKMQSEVPKWGAATKWPVSALAILAGSVD